MPRDSGSFLKEDRPALTPIPLMGAVGVMGIAAVVCVGVGVLVAEVEISCVDSDPCVPSNPNAGCRSSAHESLASLTPFHTLTKHPKRKSHKDTRARLSAHATYWPCGHKEILRIFRFGSLKSCIDVHGTCR